eukprot:TRINITY_DN9249_c0_g1_i1.p1 TRINITY_DN9249_c0_g1~~TRINITY_DN9249_c0_g1_i1.p1  ORF type:complete len:210 (+),score=25.23 TRINITY_DN9249_c0_g1_i1:67-696(+)
MTNKHPLIRDLVKHLHQVDGTSMLHCAVISENIEILKVLLNARFKGVQIFSSMSMCTDSEGYTPLHVLGQTCMFDKKYMNAAIKMLTPRFHFGMRANDGTTPLMCAVMKGNTLAAKTFVLFGASLTDHIKSSNFGGTSSLQWAIVGNDLEMFETLVNSYYKKDRVKGRRILKLHVRESDPEGLSILHRCEQNSEFFQVFEKIPCMKRWK